MVVTLCVVNLLMHAATATPQFSAAKPIWPEGRETERNLLVGFRATFEAPPGGPVTLRATGSTLYRAFVNGTFAGHGPARAGHGYYRIDEWDITAALKPGTNVVAIEVAGYNVNSYYLLDQPAFLQAEIVQNGNVLASTGGTGAAFEAILLPERIQRVQRFSFQRPFVEAYRFAPDYRRWRSDAAMALTAVPVAETKEKRLLLRGVPYPRFTERPAGWRVSQGAVQRTGDPEKAFRDRSLVGVGPELGGYPPDQLDISISEELGKLQSARTAVIDAPLAAGEALKLAPDTYEILDLGTNLSGFIGATVVCEQPCRFLVEFDEILDADGMLNWRRMSCVQAVLFDLQPGEYSLETFEPYTLRYLKLNALGAGCRVQNVYLREYANPDVWEAHFACSDPRMLRLFDAGRETFVQNAVDVFMDCPSRERAGWLCDSFFTARVAFDLGGDTAVERNFYENFLLPESFKHLPEGMLPMCYPADHYDGNFIPNWAMWFVVELQEYLARSGDRAMVDALEPKVMKLFEYFAPFENSDGLLEELEQWVFVEWSAANKFVQDVNYPTNMLYTGALDAAAAMYGRDDLHNKAEAIRTRIREQSFDGTFFVDNANRDANGTLEVTTNRTEVCQYFAFFFGVATPETHADLWTKLRDEFGPDRGQKGLYPEVHPANSFIGNMLRFELLSENGCCAQILDESAGYLLYMAERTGTLWENVDERASCNHGFASHIVHTLYRDVLGIYEVDPISQKVVVRLADVPLEWCEGRRPVPQGMVALRWRKDGAAIRYSLDIPAGYSVEIINLTASELIREP